MSTGISDEDELEEIVIVVMHVLEKVWLCQRLYIIKYRIINEKK